MARKTYRDTVHALEGKKGTTQQRIERSRQVKHKRAKSYDDPGLIERTAKRLKQLFRGPETKFTPTRYRKRFERQRRKEMLAKKPTTVRTKDVTGELKRAGLTDKEIARLRKR